MTHPTRTVNSHPRHPHGPRPAAPRRRHGPQRRALRRPLRPADQEGHQVDDLGNLDVPVRDERSVRAHSWIEANGGGLRHLPEVIAACQAIYDEAKKCAGSDVLPLFLGGDHSIAIGTVGGMACGGPLGLLWVDAHGDFNTPETSPTGNIHGMPVAALIGRGHARAGGPRPCRPQAAPARRGDDRHSRPGRRRSARRWPTAASPSTPCATSTSWAWPRSRGGRWRGWATCRASTSASTWTAIDPGVAPGVGTPVPGGLTFREAHLLMEIVAESHKIAAHGRRGDQPHPRRRQPHRRAGGGADHVGVGQANSVAMRTIMFRQTVHQAEVKAAELVRCRLRAGKRADRTTNVPETWLERSAPCHGHAVSSSRYIARPRRSQLRRGRSSRRDPFTPT